MANHDSRTPQAERTAPDNLKIEELQAQVRAEAKAWSEHYAPRAADVRQVTADDLKARAR